MKMKKVLLVLCVLALVAGSVFGTLAYLTDTDANTNTFTVGKVDLKLDEAPVGDDGKATDGDRVQENDYHLLPGYTYDKDPTVTVLAGSESAYVRILMEVSNAQAVQAIIDADDETGDAIKDYADLFGGWKTDEWLYEGFELSRDGSVIVFEFRYNGTPEGKVLNDEKELVDGDNKLSPLFTELKVPGYVTNEQLKALEDGGFQITLMGQAIQAVGFTDDDAAWTAFEDQYPVALY